MRSSTKGHHATQKHTTFAFTNPVDASQADYYNIYYLYQSKLNQ